MKTTKQNETLRHTLLEILSIRRQHGTKGEEHFIETYLSGGDVQQLKNETGEVIAYYIDNRKENSTANTTLWSCHIDTMHNSNPDTIKQDVFCDDFGTAFVSEASDCLGADDGAGAFLLLEMVRRADIGGVYVFHRGEERGCWGSKQVAILYKDFLKQFNHAIAFDRRGTTSVITHQMGERASSDTCGNAIASLLGMGYVLDDTGLFTDTAQYMEQVSECLNISIGYQSEHSNKETLDTDHVLKLRDKILAIKWDEITLPAERDYTKVEYKQGYGSTYGAYDYYGMGTSPVIDELYSKDHKGLLNWVKTAHPEDIVDAISELLDVYAYSMESEFNAYNEPYYNTLNPNPVHEWDDHNHELEHGHERT